MTTQFQKLLEPISLGPLELRNRMAMPPMTMCYANEDDGVSQQHIDYFRERAKGGVGMIMVGGVTVEGEIGKLNVPSALLRLDNDKYIAGFNRLVDTIHDYGAKAAIQLYHAGRQTSFDKTGGVQPICSSDCSTLLVGLVPLPDARAMTIEEIKQMEDNYVAAAIRAQTAGFDAVLIDGGAGYGIAQFMSPFVNKRTDEYGGDLEGRMRFPLRIIEKIKDAAGENYPLLFDLPADEFVEGGITIEESRIMAQMLEDAGIVAFRLHVGCMETYQYVVPPAAVPRGRLVNMAKEIKGVLKKAKVMVGHRIHSPQLAEEVLEKKHADVILIGRPLIADPEFPRKVAEGRIDDIQECISCNIGCAGRIIFGLPASCTVNPRVGKEATYQITPAQRPKKVLVIGGGVGGMEAARVSALRGHQVTLCEKSDKLGGMANVATIPPYKNEINLLLQYLSEQIEKLNVDIHLNREMTAEDVLDMKTEAAIIATGAQPMPVEVMPGADKHKQVVSAWDVLLEKVEVGENVAIIGGGLIGLETAEYLVAKGKKITVIEMQSDVGMDMEIFTKTHMLPRLMEADVEMWGGMRADEITKEGVLAEGELIEADTVIIATGMKSNQELYTSLKGKVAELYLIGDCVKPRRIIQAVREGFWTATQI